MRYRTTAFRQHPHVLVDMIVRSDSMRNRALLLNFSVERLLEIYDQCTSVENMPIEMQRYHQILLWKLTQFGEPRKNICEARIFQLEEKLLIWLAKETQRAAFASTTSSGLLHRQRFPYAGPHNNGQTVSATFGPSR